MGRFNGGRGKYGGRGKTKFNGAVNKGKPESKRTITDFSYRLGSAKHASDYEETTNFILNHILQDYTNGKDVVSTLKEMEIIDTDTWKPVLTKSTATDAAERDLENEQLKLDYNDDRKEYSKRKKHYEDNLVKAYGLIWERCSKAMQDKIEFESDFKKRIEYNPLELLKEIKKHSLNYHEQRYPMKTMSESFRNLFATKQRDMEGLMAYSKRFVTAKEVLESHLGEKPGIVYSNYIEKMDGYDVTDSAKIKELSMKAYERLFAQIFMENSDQSKYGSLLKNLNAQYSFGHNEYPDTVTKATNMLSQHPLDNNKSKKNKGQDKDKKPAKKDDQNEQEVQVSFAQLEGKCWCCGKTGHKSDVCYHRSKPKDEWEINKAKKQEQSHAQAQPGASQGSSTGGSVAPPGSVAPGSVAGEAASSVTGWVGAHFQEFSMWQMAEMKNWILLDNQSTTTLFCNEQFVTNIHHSPQRMEMNSNGGSIETDLKCNIKMLDFGEGWFNKNAMTNIFSFAEMADKYRITVDTEKEDACLVHHPTITVKFQRVAMNLYVFKPQSLAGVQLLNTVEENKSFYTSRQVERAKKARDMYHALGTPSVKDFKAALAMNLIKNVDVTTNDINLAEKIYGPDIGALKGKTTRRTPAPVVDSHIEIPEELIAAQHDVTMCIDGMTVNGLKFLTTISKNLYYRTAQYVERQVPNVYKEKLREIIRVYNRGNFNVDEIRADNEFRPLVEPLADEFECRMNFANPEEHVPEAERNNRTGKERIRAAYHRMPYTHLPKTLVKYLVHESFRKLNYFPAKYGVSKHYSPRMILHQETLDYAKHCKYSIGMYVQGHAEPNPSNTNAARTLDCLYLRPMNSHQGGHELLHLPTNRVITRRHVTQVPITPDVIKQVHALAKREQMPNGLKITSRTGNILFDSTWIAGVDYDKDEFDDPNYESESEEEDLEDEDDDEDQEEYEEIDQDELAGLAQKVNYEKDTQTQEEENDEEDDNPNAVDEVQEEEEHEGEAEESEETEIEVPEEVDEENTTEEEPVPRTTRSGRVIRTPTKYGVSHLQTQERTPIEYTYEEGQVMAKIIGAMNAGVDIKTVKKGAQFAQTFSLKKGLRELGESGRDAALKEMKQLHDRVVFRPIRIEEMTQQERRRALESLMFLALKRDGSVKGRTVANGSTQRAYMDRDEAASPTTMADSVMITAVIDALEERDVMIADVPNAFVQTEVDRTAVGERIVMKIRGPLVDMLLEIAPEIYSDYIVIEKGQKVLYTVVMKAIYGMLQASLLYYKKFVKDIKEIGFEINPYDPCVANRMISGKQHTITWHVDDVKSSHKDPKVNDGFHEWLTKKYASDDIGKVRVTRGKRHDYLAMILDFSDRGKLKVDMTDYVKAMVKDFSAKLSGKTSCPWNDNLFKVDKSSTILDKKRAKEFHTFVMKGMFVCKRARQDIQPAITFLSTRVSEPTEQDWKKLVRVMDFLMNTQDDVNVLAGADVKKIEWYIDAAFAVHPDFKSHTGAVMTLGSGIVTSQSTKQKVNARSSTESELIATDDMVSKVLWTKLFMEAQGHKIKANVIYRDNQSTMKLEQNGKASSGKRTRHFHIRYFYVTDLIERGEIEIEYCPTDEMLGDYMTKPLTGAKFIKFRKKIMGWE